MWANVDPDLCRHMASLGHWKNTFNDKQALCEPMLTQICVAIWRPKKETLTK